MNTQPIKNNDIAKYAYSHSLTLCIDDVKAGLCSQAQVNNDRDNILSRMDRLRAMANKQQKGSKAQNERLQISFCF